VAIHNQLFAGLEPPETLADELLNGVLLLRDAGLMIRPGERVPGQQQGQPGKDTAAQPVGVDFESQFMHCY
jgi:hypothetical protein